MGIILIFIFYVPVIVALYVMATRYKQINHIWTAILVLSLLNGGGPIVALVFLAAHRKMLQGTPAPAPTSAMAPVQYPTTAPIQYPTEQIPVDPASIANNLTAAPVPQNNSPVYQVSPQKAAGTVLGSIVGVILWISGLAIVGFFVLVTIVAIQCSNDPKCI